MNCQGCDYYADLWPPLCGRGHRLEVCSHYQPKDYKQVNKIRRMVRPKSFTKQIGTFPKFLIGVPNLIPHSTNPISKDTSTRYKRVIHSAYRFLVDDVTGPSSLLEKEIYAADVYNRVTNHIGSHAPRRHSLDGLTVNMPVSFPKKDLEEYYIEIYLDISIKKHNPRQRKPKPTIDIRNRPYRFDPIRPSERDYIYGLYGSPYIIR